MTSVSVMMTVFVLNLHYRGPKKNEVPFWIQQLLSLSLANFVRTFHKTRKVKAPIPKVQPKHSADETTTTTTSNPRRSNAASTNGVQLCYSHVHEQKSQPRVTTDVSFLFSPKSTLVSSFADRLDPNRSERNRRSTRETSFAPTDFHARRHSSEGSADVSIQLDVHDPGRNSRDAAQSAAETEGVGTRSASDQRLARHGDENRQSSFLRFSLPDRDVDDGFARRRPDDRHERSAETKTVERNQSTSTRKLRKSSLFLSMNKIAQIIIEQ